METKPLLSFLQLTVSIVFSVLLQMTFKKHLTHAVPKQENSFFRDRAFDKSS